ncbi:MAG: archease [Deltaproteobacteria bacterium]|nr:archease [Deltaproteobacteria bacterium]
MPYSYSEHISDIGIKASGPDLKSAFEEGVAAMLDIMFELDTIDEREGFVISAEAGDIETLFVEVLNEVLSVQGLNELALKRTKADEIRREENRYLFRGTAFGEKFDREKHGVKTEVKGATYSGLRYNGGRGGVFELECILDV